MTSPINVLGIGQNLKGKLGSYRIAAMLRENIWAARYAPTSFPVIKASFDPFSAVGKRNLLSLRQLLNPG